MLSACHGHGCLFAKPSTVQRDTACQCVYSNFSPLPPFPLLILPGHAYDLLTVPYTQPRVDSFDKGEILEGPGHGKKSWALGSG